MKKKIISGLLAMSLLATSGSYAFAADVKLTRDKPSGKTYLKKSVAENVVVVIPSEVPLPTANTLTGNEFNIYVQDGSNIGADDYVKVYLNKSDSEAGGYDKEKSIIKLKNGSKSIYSPLRLSKDANVEINNRDADLRKLDTTTEPEHNKAMIASFKASDKGGTDAAGITAQGYKLYAFRGYVDEGLSNVADEKKELAAGEYSGYVTFMLEIDNVEPGNIDSLGLDPAGHDNT